MARNRRGQNVVRGCVVTWRPGTNGPLPLYRGIVLRLGPVDDFARAYGREAEVLVLVSAALKQDASRGQFVNLNDDMVMQDAALYKTVKYLVRPYVHDIGINELNVIGRVKRVPKVDADTSGANVTRPETHRTTPRQKAEREMRALREEERELTHRGEHLLSGKPFKYGPHYADASIAERLAAIRHRMVMLDHRLEVLPDDPPAPAPREEASLMTALRAPRCRVSTSTSRISRS